MNEEPTKIPRSGSQFPGRAKAASTPTDRVFDDAISLGDKVNGVAKQILAFLSSGGTGSVLTELVANAVNAPDMKWWMGGAGALVLHLAVLLSDFATKVLRRVGALATRAEGIGGKVEHALNQLAAIVKRMDESQRGHESLGARVTVLEAYEAARREESEREDLAAQAGRLGIVLDADMTIEEMRRAVKRARSHGKLRPHPHKPQTDETAVPPPSVDFDSLDPEA